MVNDIDLAVEPAATAAWSVPREWGGQTAYLIGGGPSLLDFPVERLRDRGRVIVINRMVLPCDRWAGAPWADVLHFCDCGFWLDFHERILAVWNGGRITTLCKGYAVEQDKLVQRPMAHEDRLCRLARSTRLGLSNDPRLLCHGSSSGYQAINLAYLFGAARIVLLGYDLAFAGGRSHTHAGYGLRAPTVSHQLGIHAASFPSLVDPLRAAGVEVLNASQHSALECWPKITLEEALRL